MESQQDLKLQIEEAWQAFCLNMPALGRAYEAMPAEAYKDGALEGKTKRLMAITAALVHGCRACILFQTEKALELGASVEEILEAAAVAISMGGTMAAGEATRVVQFLTEKGLMQS